MASTSRSIQRQTRLIRHCARRADAIIAVSQSCKNELAARLALPSERIFVVPGGVRLEEFGGALDQAALDGLKKRLGVEREYFIHLGTVEPRKNLPRLLEAYARLRARRRDAPQLLLVGHPGWKSEETFQAIERLRLGGAAIHAGYLGRAEAVLLLRGARACVYPSIYEGFGLPVLEAMAGRTPVLASMDPAIMEVSGGTCLHVDALSVEDIETGMD